jgi:hypothetical protein
MPLPKYKWTNLETGNSGVSEFTAAQHWAFGDPDGFPQRTLDKAVAATLEKWNKQQPATWNYKLE